MRLLVLLAFGLAVAVHAETVPEPQADDGEEWAQDDTLVAEELNTIFGDDFDYDEESPRIYLKGLIGVGDDNEEKGEEEENTVNRIPAKVTNGCICDSTAHCECCTVGYVNNKNFTGCVHIDIAQRMGLLDVMFLFNGLQVSQNQFSVRRHEENCKDVMTTSEIMTLCVNSRTTVKPLGVAVTCLKTVFKTFKSAVELKFKCIRHQNGQLSVA
uniref:Venom protein family 2 protein 6 n=1 Tax=Lethocerus distinctifemur TaxID=280095 RepID=A0A2K8JLF6_9HEMI|nr:venom protein family 2 protein 6 [Lethocerus distinctifemur]